MLFRSTVIQQNASASEEMASMAEELSSQAEQLSEAISYFKINTDTSGQTRKLPGGQGVARVQQPVNVAHAGRKPTAPAAVTARNVSPSRTAITLRAGKANQVVDDADFEEF